MWLRNLSAKKESPYKQCFRFKTSVLFFFLFFLKTTCSQIVPIFLIWRVWISSVRTPQTVNVLVRFSGCVRSREWSVCKSDRDRERERERERDGGWGEVEEELCGGMREWRVKAREQACSVSRWMRNWSWGKSVFFWHTMEKRGRGMGGLEIFLHLDLHIWILVFSWLHLHAAFFHSVFSPVKKSYFFGSFFSSSAGGFVCSRQAITPFFSLPALFSPHASLVLDLQASFSPLPWYFGLLSLLPSALDCLFYLLDHTASSSFHFSGPVLSAFSAGCIYPAPRHPPWASRVRLYFHIPLVIRGLFQMSFSSSCCNVTVFSVGHSAAGSPPCCWAGTWRWCCALWTWASSAPARWHPPTCHPSRGPLPVAVEPNRAPWSFGKRRW